MEKPLVSVIIAAYRQPRFLNAALESVARQTYSNIEIIVVDDASGEEFTNQYRLPANARMMMNPVNRGIAAVSRNIALREARGDYVAFIDQDDLWLPEKTEVQIQALEAHRESLLHYVHFVAVDEKSQPTETQHEIKSPSDMLAAMIRGCWINPSQVMIRRSAFERVGLFDEGIRGSSDWDMFLRVAACGRETIISDPRRLTMYRYHDGQWSKSRLMMAKAAERVIAKARETVTRHDLQWLLRRRHAKWLRELARVRLEEGTELEQLWPALRQAWRTWPLDAKTYQVMAKALVRAGFKPQTTPREHSTTESIFTR